MKIHCNPLLVVVLCVFLVGSSAAAWGQSSTTERIEDFAEEGPPSVVGSSPDQVKLEGGQANGQGEVVISFLNGLGLKISSPTDKDTETTEFTNLDGLANNLSVAVTWSRVGLGLVKVQDVRVVAQRQQKVCDDNKVPEAECVSDGSVEKFLKERGRSDREVRKAVLEFDRATFQDAWIWGTFIEGKVGNKKYEFFDQSAHDQVREEISRSISASIVGIYGPGRVSFGLTQQTAFEESKVKVRRCTAVDGSTALEECKELPLGVPAEVDSIIARTELRHIFGKWALSPLISHDFEKSVWGLELPIYFLPDSKGVLTGGLRLGWRSDEDDIKASVFVAKPLSLR